MIQGITMLTTLAPLPAIRVHTPEAKAKDGQPGGGKTP